MSSPRGKGRSAYKNPPPLPPGSGKIPAAYRWSATHSAPNSAAHVTRVAPLHARHSRGIAKSFPQQVPLSLLLRRLSPGLPLSFHLRPLDRRLPFGIPRCPRSRLPSGKSFGGRRRISPRGENANFTSGISIRGDHATEGDGEMEGGEAGREEVGVFTLGGGCPGSVVLMIFYFDT